MSDLEIQDDLSLQQLFEAGLEVQKKIENGEITSLSEEFKSRVTSGIKCLEQATRLASQLDLFSSNEVIEEVPSGDLKYLLLPALLGDLTLQISDEDRIENSKNARIYFIDYLQRCKSYSITDEDPPPPRSSTPPPSDGTSSKPKSSPSPGNKKMNYDQMSAERAAKIARYKAQKEMERNLKEATIRLNVSAAQSPSNTPDDELVRNHFVALLKVWVFKCRDYVSSVDQEIELLEGMEKMRSLSLQTGQAEAAALPPKRKPMKPVIITRNMLQSKVFGAGYPSLPVMSVEEFYQQKYQEQVEQREGETAHAIKSCIRDDSRVGGAVGGATESEELEPDADKDEDSEESIQKEREWDDFKDDNRRGWGNKKNMG